MNQKNNSDNKIIMMLVILLCTLWIAMGFIQIKIGSYNKAAGYFGLAILGLGAAFVYYHKKN